MITLKENILIKIFIFSVFLAVSFFPMSKEVGAQGIGVDAISVKMTPVSPKPGDTVRASLVSYSADLDRSKIFWSVNGKTISSGVGQKTFSFTVGQTGTETILNVFVESDSVGVFEKEIKINPGTVDIIWEAVDSYVPPFYKGKALPAPNSKIRAVAISDLRESPNNPVKYEDIVYKWSFDDNPILNKSGLGNNYIDFVLNYVSPGGEISVNASSLENTGLLTENKISFSTIKPIILFYENKPLEGVSYESSISNNIDLKNEEIKIVAEPYYFSTENKVKNDLSLNWYVTYKEALVNAYDKGEITLRKPERGSGTSVVSIDVRNIKKFLQKNTAGFNINFSNNE